MVIHFVRFTTGMPIADVQDLIQERMPAYGQVAGLVQKYYGHDPETNAFCGVFIFESHGALESFTDSDLSRSFASVYRLESVRSETFELTFALDPRAGSVTTTAESNG